MDVIQADLNRTMDAWNTHHIRCGVNGIPDELKKSTGSIRGIQSSLRTKDTLGTGILSSFRRLSLSRRLAIV